MIKGILIRKAVPADTSTILRILADLAAWEGASQVPMMDETCFETDVFSDKPKTRILVATTESGLPVGFLSYYDNYSSWQGSAGVHIGDLWVDPDARSQSVGSSLLNRLVSDHAEGRIDVFVIRSNSARQFYERLGFIEQTEWLLYRRFPAAPNSPR